MWTGGNPAPAHGQNLAVFRAISGGSASVRLVASWSVAAVLTGFHTWLFWVHATTGRLLDPSTAGRWLAAALILCGFLVLRRMGRPLTSGRQALVLWLLVALLHGHAVVGAAERVPAAAIPETVTVVLTQIATTAPAVLLAAGPLLLLMRRRVARPRALALTEVPRFACGIPLTGHVLRFSARPPPRLLPA